MLVLLVLFAFPLIMSLITKKYKLTIASLICALPAVICVVVNICGYIVVSEIIVIVATVSAILLSICSVISVPVKPAKIATGVVSFVIVVATIWFSSIPAHVDVTVNEKEYVAYFSSFVVGPTVVSYHEKISSTRCNAEPDFYSGVWIMGSAESIKQAIVDGDVSDFKKSYDEVISDLADN